MSVHMNFHELMGSYDAEITQNAINSFKPEFLIHPHGVLCQISVVEIVILNT